MDVTYEMIKPIIVKEEVNGQMINLEFKTDNMDQAIPSMAVVVPDPNEIMKNAAKSTAVNSAIGGAARLLGGVLGSAASKIGREVAGQVMGNPGEVEMTDANKQKAIVTAFGHLKQ